MSTASLCSSSSMRVPHSTPAAGVEAVAGTTPPGCPPTWCSSSTATRPVNRGAACSRRGKPTSSWSDYGQEGRCHEECDGRARHVARRVRSTCPAGNCARLKGRGWGCAAATQVPPDARHDRDPASRRGDTGRPAGDRGEEFRGSRHGCVGGSRAVGEHAVGSPALKPVPVAIRRANDWDVAIRWSDGHEAVYPAIYLRRACCCAPCLERRGGDADETLDPDVQPLAIHAIGTYAIQFEW